MVKDKGGGGNSEETRGAKIIGLVSLDTVLRSFQESI